MATLYAQPTKEWIVPAKPKPGRKPKLDGPVEDHEEAGDSKAKKVQNRAAQRAFRERKQSQLADLQARLTQYEQGEIERNVALQNVARKLKEENERLKSDNDKLREEGDRVREENMQIRTQLRGLQEELLSYKHGAGPSSRFEVGNAVGKRPRADSAAPLSVIVPGSPSSTTKLPTGKRRRGNHDKRSSEPGTSISEQRRSAAKRDQTLPPDYVLPERLQFSRSPTSSDAPSRASLATSPDASENSASIEAFNFDAISPHGNLADSNFGTPSSAVDIVDCGFCSKNPDECICREVDRLIKSAAPDNPEKLGGSETISAPSLLSPAAVGRSILDNLPPVQAGVPLRRRAKQPSAKAYPDPIQGEAVHLTPVPQPVEPRPTTKPVCSGDPSNCAACADDPFGRAFCTALARGGICRDDKCPRCPKNGSSSRVMIDNAGEIEETGAFSMDVDAGPGPSVGLGVGMNMETGMLLCCGDPKLCGGGGCGIGTAKASQLPELLPRAAGSSSRILGGLQPHTHSVIDSDLVIGDKMDVGNTAKASENKDIPTNEAWAQLKAHPNVAFTDLALLADVVARRTKCIGSRVSLSPAPEDVEKVDAEGSESTNQSRGRSTLHPPPTLVPHAALVQCKHERMMRVQAEGVRDALAMLDVQRPTGSLE